jgi:phosphopantetheinyl transferase (holo-ACP synthase)
LISSTTLQENQLRVTTKMPPRPFPQTISIGTDICHYPRFNKYFPIHQHLASTTTAISSQTLLFKLFDKVFVPAEQRAFWRRFQPSASKSLQPGGAGSTEQSFWSEKKAEEAAKYIGGRWAAKEACIKAFAQKRRLVLRDVRVWSSAQGQQPFGLVVDEVEEGVKYDSAKEIYERFVRWRGLVGELKVLLQQQREGSASGLRIIKRASLNRHTARTMEMKKMEPPPPPPQQETGSSIRRPVDFASSATTPPQILSKTGILDLNAITSMLNQQEEPSTLTTTTSQTPQAETKEDAEPQTQQDRLQKEIERLSKEETEEDGWENAQGQIVKLSISHDGEYCVATALAAV